MNKKVCSQCKTSKNVTEFGIKSGKPRSACKSCINSKSRKYLKDSPDKVRETKRKWKKNNKDKVRANKHKWYNNNRDKIIQYKKNYYEDNKERLNAESKEYHGRNKERDNERSRNWHKNNPEKSRALNIKRREKEKEFDFNYGYEHYIITMNVFGKKCAKCMSTENLCIDHHYCLNDGNGLSIDNAVVLCRTCNSSKGTKLPEEFYSKNNMITVTGLLKVATKLFGEEDGNKN